MTDPYHISDEVINEAFKGTNYGKEGTDYYRSILAEGMLKVLADYHNGYTTDRILKKLNLITEKGNPTKFGRRFCCHYYYFKQT